MTTSDYTSAGPQDRTGVSTEGSGDGSAGAKEQAQQAAGAAADQGKHLAGVARTEAGNVAEQARAQAQSLMQQAGQELDGQSRQQKDRLAGTLRTFGDDLQGMASQGNDGLAAQLAREAAGRARSLSSHLEQRDPGELLADVRDFARRRPGTFLLGAFAAGLVAGRLARGAKAAQGGDTVQVSGSAAVASSPTSTTGLPAPASTGEYTEATPFGATRPTPAAPYAAEVPTAATGVRDPLADPLAGEPTVTTSTSADDTWTDPSQHGSRP
jgi:hypothetical protein